MGGRGRVLQKEPTWGGGGAKENIESGIPDRGDSKGMKYFGEGWKQKQFKDADN